MKNRWTKIGNNIIIYLDRKNDEVIETIISPDSLQKADSFKGKWYPHWNPHTNSFYVYGSIKENGKWGSTRLHRWLLDNPEGLVIDHINHNSLDNRIENLRMVTNAENIRNSKGVQSNNKSGIAGVYWYKRKHKWHASFRYNSKRIFVGYFDTVEEAEKAINNKRKEAEDK